MKISIQELIEMGATINFQNRFLVQTVFNCGEVEVSSLVGGLNTIDDFLWLASKKIDRTSMTRFASECALINIEKLKPFTNEYDQIVKWLKEPTVEGSTRIAEVSVIVIKEAASVRSKAASVYAVTQVVRSDNFEEATILTSNAAVYAAESDELAVNSLLVKMFDGIE